MPLSISRDLSLQLPVGFTALSFLPEIRAKCLRWPHLQAGGHYRVAIIKLITTPAQRASGSVTLEASPPPTMCPPLPGEHRAGVRVMCPWTWDLRPPCPRGPGGSLVSLRQWTRDEGRPTGLGEAELRAPPPIARRHSLPLCAVCMGSHVRFTSKRI